MWCRLDLLIYTPQEFADMVRDGRPFIEQVLQEGVVIHEAEPER